MITYTEGNLLKSSAEALVNTVNEVGIMGKGIALMFKEAYPENNAAYERACKQGNVQVGHIFVFENTRQWGPKWIVNFPTKKHWRNPSKLEWVRDGLGELRDWVTRAGIKSIAVPPLGCGNGGLDWSAVRELITSTFSSLESVDIQVYVPTSKYQNSPKTQKVRKLTPARAMIAEMVHRYGVLGFDCSMLEIQKLAWFMQRGLAATRVDNPLKLTFEPRRYGPYSDALRHVLDGLDGSFLHSTKRIADATRHDVISFDEKKEGELDAFLMQTKMRKYADAIVWTQHMIEGFESPYGMELLATVDWLIQANSIAPTVDAIKAALRNWPHSVEAATRKSGLFDDRVLSIAIQRILETKNFEGSQKALKLESADGEALAGGPSRMWH